MREHVEADDVEGAEGRGLRAAQRRPRHLVNLFNRAAVLLHHAQSHDGAEGADAVGDEVRAVFRHHHALPQTPV